MKRSWVYYCISILLVSIVLACQLPTIVVPETVEPEIGGTSFPIASMTPIAPVPSSELTLVGYGYTVKDVGDGWNEGLVYLALENKTDQLAGFNETLLPSAVLETQEGQDYEVVLGYMDYMSIFEGNYQVEAVPLIPPGFRVNATFRRENLHSIPGKTPLYATFRFAYSTHPTTLSFPGTKHRVDLSAAQTNAIGYVGSESSSFQPITALYGQILVDDPTEAKVVVEKCIIREGTFSGYVSPALLLSIENRDKFQENRITVAVPPGVGITPDGSVGPITQFNDFIIGPGQTEEVGFRFIYINFGLHSNYANNYYIELWPTGYIVFFDDSPRGYTVYTLNDCIYTR